MGSEGQIKKKNHAFERSRDADANLEFNLTYIQAQLIKET